MQNSVFYSHPVYDPFFLATSVDSNNTFLADNLYNTFQADNLFNAMGCIDQLQFCNPKTNGCTEVTHTVAAYEEALRLDLNIDQQIILNKTAILAGMINVASAGLDTLGSLGELRRMLFLYRDN
jgi:hypothetical protein